MVKVLIDTNILHQEGLSSTRFQVLQRLIKSKDVSLVIPEMVVKEYKSKRISQANDEFKKIQSGIDNLNRKSVIKKDSFAVSQLHSLVSASIGELSSVIDNWLDDNQVEIYPIAKTSIVELFDNYFEGVGAFRNKKNREDIPDAVIFDCIVKLSLNEKISVIAKDGALIDAISKLDNVTVYKEIAELLEVQSIKEKLVKLDAGEKKVKSIIDELSTTICELDISEYLKNNELVEVKGFYDEDIVGLPYELDNFDINNHEVQVYELIEVYVDSPTYLGGGTFSYELSAECLASLSFRCESDVYESLPYEYRKKFLKSEFINSQHEVQVKGDVEISFQGVLILSGIDESTEPSSLKVHLSYLGAEQSTIECEVKLEKLQVQDIY